MNVRLLIAGLFFAASGIATSSLATTYTYELSNEQTWSDGGSSNTAVSNVSVRVYVPGSKRVSYKTVPIYTPTYASEANSLGDVVGTVYTIYGSGHTAYVDPHDGPKKTVVYPAVQILHTELLSVNDDRLAVGNYHVLGGHARGRGFIYDVVHDQYTELVAPNTAWTDIGDINNAGRIVGTRINDDGATRKGFVYDCYMGFEEFDVPGSWWTVPQKIDDEGNIYGTVSGIADAAYFIARPDYADPDPPCSLVPRDDVAEPLIFGNGFSFEMSGDEARGVKIGDFDGGGVKDLLVYHEIGKTILYLGETGFDDKIRYRGNEFNSLGAPDQHSGGWDFDNDGLEDRFVQNGRQNLLYLARAEGEYFYVPQSLPGGNLKLGDMDGDGLVDILTFSGGFVSISYQSGGSGSIYFPAPDPDPVPVGVRESDPAPDRAAEPDRGPKSDPALAPVSGGGSPAVDFDAIKIEDFAVIAEVRENSLLLSSGAVLWFNRDSVIKLNDAFGFDTGQSIEFKAWANPDGALICIKAEIVT